VLFANLPWLVFPVLIIGRMAGAEHPFTVSAAPPAPAAAGAAVAAGPS
jgi:hypothetical protein